MPEFSIVTGPTVARILGAHSADVVDVVRRAYLAHDAGDTDNPPSAFLRFTDRPNDRIIALLASIRDGNAAVDGMKWVASVPGNIDNGLARASAVVVLNDRRTGYPFACLEGSAISATRTAASAALAARLCHPGGPERTTLGVVGAGPIARTIVEYLFATGWTFDCVTFHDSDPGRARSASAALSGQVEAAENMVADTAEQAVRESRLVVFATTAAAPYITNPACLDHNPTVLNVSLRDLDPALILAGSNIVDDVDHCLRAGTSVHLTEQQTGSRDFVTGTLGDVLRGRVTLPTDRPIIFSPFGLGILDMALGKFVYDRAVEEQAVQAVPDFFPPQVCL